MNNWELKDIFQEIERSTGLSLTDIAAKADLDRSNLSSFINSSKEKEVTDRMFGRLNKAFPNYFLNRASKQHFTTDPTTSDALLAEKEARRKETADRLERADKEKDALMELLQLSLKDLKGLVISSYAHLEAYTHHSADLEAGGDDTKRKRILEELNKKKGDFQKVLKGGGSKKAESK